MWMLFFALAWLFIESLGFPLLSEGAFGPLSTASHKGTITLKAAYLAAYLVTIIGNAIGFLAFWHYGPAIVDRLGRYWPSLTTKLKEVEPRIRPKMFAAMFVARFVGLGTFGIVLWVAGLVRTPWKLFLPFLFIINLVWVSMWLFASHALVRMAIRSIRQMDRAETILFGIACVVGYFALHKGIKLVASHFRKPSVD